MLVSGRGVDDPVFWLSEREWTSWDWHARGSDGSVNFTGVPLERIMIGGIPVIRTTYGGVVMVRSDTPGIALVGGAWTYWLDHGGPDGPLGLPMTFPTGRGVGAEQGFERGTLRLPGVTNPFDALLRPPSDYRWEPFATHPPAMPVVPNSIVDFGDKWSFYVDRDGVRHWLRTQALWSCAVWDLGATRLPVHDAGSVAAIPLGPAFECPS